MIIALSDRLERMRLWWAQKNSRPLLGFYIGSQYPLHRYAGCRRSLPDGPVQPDDVVIADYLEDCERLYATYEAYGGDLIWSSAPFFGLPWVEASLGCRVMADHKSGSTRSEPPPALSVAPESLRFSADNAWVRKLLEFIPALQAESRGRYPVGVTLMRGISDLLCALYGGEELLMRAYEQPDEVAAFAGPLADYWVEFGKLMLDSIPLYHGGTGCFFYSLWSPGKTIWMQEDAAALLSPALYDSLIHPHVERIASEFERTVMHLHPARFMPVDRLVDSSVGAIEIHIDHGGPSAEDLYPSHAKVVAAKPLFVYGDVSAEDLKFMLDHLPPEGLAVNMAVDSAEHARSCWEILKSRYNTEVF